MSHYPECFPENIDERIRAAGGKICTREGVFRILPEGVCDRNAFLGSYEEKKLRGDSLEGQKLTAGSYSTSCYSEYDAAIQRLEISFKDSPVAKVAVGTIRGEFGPSTDPKPATKHIHWWVYKDASPQDDFCEVKEDAE